MRNYRTLRTIKTIAAQSIDNLLKPRHSGIVDNPYISGKLFPLEGDNGYYIMPLPQTVTLRPDDDAFPVPPKQLWEGYGNTPEEYLSSGRQNMQSMLDILHKANVHPEELPRVLEFGCASARMLRFFPLDSRRSEVWGVDIKAENIAWCQRNMSPPLFFTTITSAPHLPFEDNYFDMIYCGSVFTHISDLADAWLLELRRILKKGGHLYITIQDKHSVEVLLSRYPDSLWSKMIHNLDERTALLSKDYAYFSFGVDPWIQVFYDTEYLTSKWSRLMDMVSVTPEAYGWQTALLARK
jgi:ubiquinone/menaquinone biosynthesis C-methylase UbiE